MAEAISPAVCRHFCTCGTHCALGPTRLKSPLSIASCIWHGLQASGLKIGLSNSINDTSVLHMVHFHQDANPPPFLCANKEGFPTQWNSSNSEPNHPTSM